MRRRYAVNSKPITIVLNVLIVLVIAPLAVSLAQTTYYVNGTCGDDSWTGTSPVCQAPDGPKANIRPVLLATQNSDTVIVADGVYSGEQNTGLLFDGKLITVRSENGPILCIIDCQVPPKTSSPFAFLFSVRETLEAVLDGFTITNSENSALICRNNSSPTIRNCIFLSNYHGPPGGAITLENSNAHIRNCDFIDNHSLVDGGAIVVSGDSAPLIVESRFWNNTAPFGQGGAIYDGSYGNDPAWVISCVFGGNSADYGGAIFNSRSDAALVSVNCVFAGNRAHAHGGAVSNASTYLAGVQIINCAFSHNVATAFGGGLFNFSPAVVSNAIFWENSDATGGGEEAQIHAGFRPLIVEYSCVQGWTGALGGVGNIGDDPLFVDALGPDGIAGTPDDDLRLQPGSPAIDAGFNCALPPTAGLFNFSPAVVSNAIFWENSDATGGGEEAQIHAGFRPLIVEYSCVQGWTGALGGVGNIGDDPLFVDALGPDGIAGTPDDDLRLQPGSPAIDAGFNCALPPDVADLDGDGDRDEITPLDLAGEIRLLEDPATPDTGRGIAPLVDMGAYELSGGLPPCPGDLDADWDVDLADLGILLAAFGRTDEGDIDCNGETDLADLGILLAHFGETCP